MANICKHCGTEFIDKECKECGAVNEERNWRRYIKPQKLVVICNYGQVRSKTMAACIKSYFNDKALMIENLGVLNYNPKYLELELKRHDKIVVCNKHDLDLEFDGNQHSQKVELVKVINSFKDKFIICDTIKDDKWQRPFHPELIIICNKWIKENEKRIIE